MKHNVPCLGCQDRNVTIDFNCHNNCEKFAEFRQKIEEASVKRQAYVDRVEFDKAVTHRSLKIASDLKRKHTWKRG